MTPRFATRCEPSCGQYSVGRALTELRELIADHRKTDHESPDEKCPQSDQLEAIAKELEKQVVQSVS